MSSHGHGNYTVRIIDPFPLAPENMQKLIFASENFCFITGDQSVSEAITSEKIFIYQVMLWKLKFFTALIAEAKKLGCNLLAEFWQMQITKSSSENEVWRGIYSYLRNNEKKLIDEMRTLKKHLSHNRNLSTKLTKEILSHIYNV